MNEMKVKVILTLTSFVLGVMITGSLIDVFWDNLCIIKKRTGYMKDWNLKEKGA